jgi:hypothetical protein
MAEPRESFGARSALQARMMIVGIGTLVSRIHNVINKPTAAISGNRLAISCLLHAWLYTL